MAKWGERFLFSTPLSTKWKLKKVLVLCINMLKQLSVKLVEQSDVDHLAEKDPPTGGDYMRMWTKVIVEDDYYHRPKKVLPNTGNLFDAFYFIGPSDVQDFFLSEARSLSQAVEIYFARKYSLDTDFKNDFDCVDRNEGYCQLLDLSNPDQKGIWEERRLDFFRYYAIKAGINFSRGSHDEWNIVHLLNAKRLKHPDIYGPEDQIAILFDGKQVDPGSFSAYASPGYATQD